MRELHLCAEILRLILVLNHSALVGLGLDSNDVRLPGCFDMLPGHRRYAEVLRSRPPVLGSWGHYLLGTASCLQALGLYLWECWRLQLLSLSNLIFFEIYLVSFLYFVDSTALVTWVQEFWSNQLLPFVLSFASFFCLSFPSFSNFSFSGFLSAQGLQQSNKNK